MQPHPLAALAPVADQLDPQLGADEVDGAEPRDERVGGHPHAERDLVGDLERRLERDLAVQLGRRRARLDGSRIAPRREGVQTDAALPEPLPHAVGLHRRELPERLHAEPGEQSHEVAGATPGASDEPAPSDDASSTATDSGARKPAAPPAGTTKTGSAAVVPTFAACSAVNGPSAMPARTPSSPASRSTPSSTRAASASPP